MCYTRVGLQGGSRTRGERTETVAKWLLACGISLALAWLGWQPAHGEQACHVVREATRVELRSPFFVFRLDTAAGLRAVAWENRLTGRGSDSSAWKPSWASEGRVRRESSSWLTCGAGCGAWSAATTGRTRSSSRSARGRAAISMRPKNSSSTTWPFVSRRNEKGGGGPAAVGLPLRSLLHRLLGGSPRRYQDVRPQAVSERPRQDRRVSFRRETKSSRSWGPRPACGSTAAGCPPGPSAAIRRSAHAFRSWEVKADCAAPASRSGPCTPRRSATSSAVTGSAC